jgi:transposase
MIPSQLDQLEKEESCEASQWSPAPVPRQDDCSYAAGLLKRVNKALRTGEYQGDFMRVAVEELASRRK